jgi:gas vesicle protein
MVIVGGLVGATLGAAAAWAYAQSQSRQIKSGIKAAPQAAAADYVKIAVAVVAVLRQVAELFKPVPIKA